MHVDVRSPHISSSQVALPFSSGTTGLSKGVILTHHNLVSALLTLLVDNPLSRGGVVLSLLPFFHIYAMVCMMGAALHLGTKLVLLTRFEPNSFLKTLQDYKVRLLVSTGHIINDKQNSKTTDIAS